MQELRESGIDILGKIPWGSHFCHFYDTKQDLLDFLVPFFKAGLENNEFCLWVISMPELITEEEAKKALRQSIPDVDQYFAKKKIEIINSHEWYLGKNEFNAEKIIKTWHIKFKTALGAGCDGMRVSGDTLWLNEKYWDAFYAYEKKLNYFAANIPLIVLCLYPLAKINAANVFDIMQTHQFAIARRKGEWEVIETVVQIDARSEIKRLNKELKGDKISMLPMGLRYLISILSVTAALLLALFLHNTHFVSAPASLFLCAIIFSTLYGGIKPGIFAMLLSILAFKFYLIGPLHSFVIEISQVPRFLIFLLSGLFVMLLSAAQRSKTESLRQAARALDGTVEKLQKTNAMLQYEITEHKHSEDALKESEIRLRQITENIREVFWMGTPSMNEILYVSPAYESMWGRTVESLHQQPQSFFEGIHPEDRERVASIVKGQREQEFDVEYRIIRPDGSVCWIRDRGFPIKNESGEVYRIAGISDDITERKQAEDAIQKKQDELRLAYQRLSYHFENTPLAVIELDKDLFIKRWSKQAEEIFGWKASEALGKNVHDPDFPIIYKDDIPAVDEINEQLTTGSVNRNLSLNRNYTKDGKVIYSEWYNSVLRDEQGNVITILSLVHNITQRKKAEEKLNQSYEEIKRLTERLQIIREEERAHIAREIHDELGQQLAVLKMDIKGLDKKLNGTDEAQKLKIKDILDLLDTTAKSVRKISSKLRPTLLHNLGLVAAMEWYLKEFEKKSGIEISFKIHKDELAMSDLLKNGLFRIFQESLTNITKHANATKVKVALDQEGQQLTLSIEDNGQGLDVDNIAFKDTLGILGMRERSHIMGGKFEIKSISGKGTTIIATVPYFENSI